MRFLKPRTLVALALFCVGGQGLLAQNPTARPTPEQARALLQARPELVQQLRQRLLNSGLTRDQIHARLRAEGYPEDLLDPYLSGMSGQVDAPSSELYNAVQELGIADSTDVAFLRALQADSLSPAMRDSLLRLRDTTGQSLDSLGVRAPRRTVVRADVADSLMRVDSGFNIFGLEMFRSSASRFEPSLMGPVDANYRLGPGDRVNRPHERWLEA